LSASVLILTFGFFLGIRHATDPDHVIAVSTIVSRERSVLRAGLVGILWGCGHTLTVLLVGMAIILFGVKIPVRVGLTMEFSVGLMLILLGILNLTGTMKLLSERLAPHHPKVHGQHADIHDQNSAPHLDWHSHSDGESRTPPHFLRAPFELLGIFHALRPLIVGIVHGLAGSAAVTLLILGAIRNPRWAILYLLIFGAGTIAGMMLITAAMALPFSISGNRFSWVNKGLVTASGVLSFCFGLFICYQLGFVNGLFSTHPTWNPN
jgi:ABC-type nickel/cobalt efflux system permease component RcnA